MTEEKFWHQKIFDFTKTSKPDTPKYLQIDLLNTLRSEPVPWKLKDPFQFRVAKSTTQIFTDRQVKIPNCKSHQNDSTVADRSVFCKYVIGPASVYSKDIRQLT